MSTNDIYSNAFNFESYFSSDVDCRTGQFTASLDLFEIQSSEQNGPVLAIKLIYSPLNSADLGFGKGWSLLMSQYDTESKVFGLSTGESYMVDFETDDYIAFKDKKLNTFNVTKADRNGRTVYTVIHKDGCMEELTSPNDNNQFFVSKLINENGVGIHVEYSYDQQPQLTQITDQDGQVLLRIHYDDQVRIERLPNITTESATILLTRLNGLLTFVSLPNETSKGFDLLYKQVNGLALITELTNPTKGTISITYKDDGHLLPEGAPFDSLPYAISKVVNPGFGQPVMTHDYSYSSTNFLGYGSDISWSDDGDNLYLTETDYTYSATESITATINGSTSTQTITRTFNKFHLMTSEVSIKGIAKLENETDYWDDVNIAFDDQPAYYKLAKTMTVRYTNLQTQATRQEVSRFSYDDYGNTLSYTDPSGLCINSVFYPVSGESGHCPADDRGFVRHLKTQTTIPVSTSHGETNRTVTCQYQALPSLQSGAPAFLVRTSESYSSGLVRRFTYYSDASHAISYGKLASNSEVLANKTTSQTLSYALSPDGGALTTTTVTTGHQGNTKQIIVQTSRYSGLVLSSTDEDGIETRISYDALQRPTLYQTCPGTSNAASQRYAYSLTDTENAVTYTNAKGHVTKHSFDGSARVIKVEIADSRGNLQPVQTNVYDGAGQLNTSVEHDVLDSNKQLSLTTRYHYSDWGDIDIITHPDGRQELCTKDPVANTLTQGIVGQATTVITNNVSGKEVARSILIPNSNGTSTHYADTSKQYDGFGRLILDTDPLGNQTHYRYDSFDRIIECDGPEQFSVSMGYVDFRPETMINSLTVNGTTVATRSYDDIGRLTNITLGTRSTRFGYHSSVLQYDQITTPANQTIQLGYNKALRAISSMTSGSVSVNNVLDQVSAMKTASSGGASTNFYSYSPTGALLGQQFTPPGQLAKTLTNTLSLLERPLSCNDYLSATSTNSYDSAGRLNQTDYRFGSQSARATLSYDDHGLLQQYVYADTSNQQQVSVRMERDSLGRETKRTISATNQADVEIALEYDQLSRITSQTRRSNNQTLLAETFGYDHLNRMTTYQCSGPFAPWDEHGLQLSDEHFTFNNLGAISTVVRHFQNGQSNTATYRYDTQNPFCLSQISNTHPAYPATVSIQYDSAGRMTRDLQGRTLTYDALGRLTQVANGQTVLASYDYNAEGQLCKLNDTTLWYSGDTLRNESSSTSSRVYHRQVGMLLGGIDNQSQRYTHWLLKTDSAGTPLAAVSTGASQQTDYFAHTPYGYRQEVTASGSLKSSPSSTIPIGMNGERVDTAVALYHLGNGYRAYSPSMMCFHAPDNASPFGPGGINPYTYCGGAPINFSDPSGHASLGKILTGVLGILAGLATLVLAPFTGGSSLVIGLSMVSGLLGATSGALGVAAACTTGETSKNLSIASLAFGVGAMLTGIGAAGAGMGRTVTRPKEGGRTGKKKVVNYKVVRRSKDFQNLAVNDGGFVYSDGSKVSFRGESESRMLLGKSGLDIRKTEVTIDFGKYDTLQRLTKYGGMNSFLPVAFTLAGGAVSNMQAIGELMAPDDDTDQDENQQTNQNRQVMETNGLSNLAPNTIQLSTTQVPISSAEVRLLTPQVQ